MIIFFFDIFYTTAKNKMFQNNQQNLKKLKDLPTYSKFKVLEYKPVQSQYGTSYLLTIEDEKGESSKCFVNTKNLIHSCNTRGCGFSFKTRCMSQFEKNGQQISYMPVDVLA